MTTYLLIGLALMMIPFIQHVSPSQSVKDPAAILLVLFVTMAVSTVLIAFQRTNLKEPQVILAKERYSSSLALLQTQK
jgi:hypothetical protein